MLEFANTTPANGRNKKGNLCKRARRSSAYRTHTQKIIIIIIIINKGLEFEEKDRVILG